MWLFTRYGFFSIACGTGPCGVIDPATTMIRARSRKHLDALQRRMPALHSYEIAETAMTDYRYRLVVPKDIWLSVLAEIADEQDWSNFKNEAHRFAKDPEYDGALHSVWARMYRLQRE